MTQAQRNNYIEEWKRTLRAIERRYVSSVYKALKGQIAEVEQALRIGGIEFARRQASSLQFNAPMAETIQTMHRRVGVMMARRTFNRLEKEPLVKKGDWIDDLITKATMGDIASWLEEIIQFFRMYLLDSVSSINETTREWIYRKLNQGFQSGWSVDDIATAINDREYLGHRAEVIVRTESVRAANFGVQKAAETYEFVTEKEWVAVRDDRTRHTHRAVNGETRPLSETFSNGLMFPGDPAGSAREVVNCRCAQVINPVRDSNGRLIPKQRSNAQI